MFRRNKKLVFKLLTIIFILEVFWLVTKLWKDSNSRIANKRRIPLSIQEEYVVYTTHLRGLKPIQSESLVDNQLLPIINDVYNFKYIIDIESERLIPGCQIDNGHNHLLLLIVVSAPDNQKERQLIRKSLAQQRSILAAASNQFLYQLVFLVGLFPGGQEQLKQKDIIDESKKNGDLVQIDMIDTYSNLTIKSVALLHWAHTHCFTADYVIKSDDDNYINALFLLIELIPNLVMTNDEEGAIYGTTNVFLWPSRDKGSRHYVNRIDWPWSKYPLYLMGGAYILSGRDTVRRLLAAVQTAPYFPFEDTYILGICASLAGINLRYFPRFYQPEYNTELDPCMVRNMAVWNAPSSELFIQSNLITLDAYQRDLNCNRIECTFGACW